MKTETLTVRLSKDDLRLLDALVVEAKSRLGVDVADQLNRTSVLRSLIRCRAKEKQIGTKVEQVHAPDVASGARVIGFKPEK